MNTISQQYQIEIKILKVHKVHQINYKAYNISIRIQRHKHLKIHYKFLINNLVKFIQIKKLVLHI